MKKIYLTIIFGVLGFWISRAQVLEYDDSQVVVDSTGAERGESLTIYSDEEEPDAGSLEISWPQYSKWDVVTLEGKIKMKGLPLSPSVKIFMERDRMINISLRAPFVGEVARVELTPTTVLVVNKINKVFIKENLQNFEMISASKLGINDIQDLLLGRFFIPGYDVNTADLDDLLEIFYEDEQINVVPRGEARIEGVNYGYSIDEDFNPLLMIVVPEKTGSDLEFSAEYLRKSSGYNIIFDFLDGQKSYEMTLELKSPSWNGEAPGSIDLGSKYKQVSLNQFLRNIGM